MCSHHPIFNSTSTLRCKGETNTDDPSLLWDIFEHQTNTLSQIARTWAFIYRYFPALKEKRAAFVLNHPKNKFIVLRGLHFDFGSFRIALEKIAVRRSLDRTVVSDAATCRMGRRTRIL